MTESEIVFKPRYKLRDSVASYITWPLGIIGFIASLIYIVMGAFHNDGLSNIWFSIIIWGIVSFFPPLIYIRAIHFGKHMVVKRYFLSDWVIKYEDVTRFDRDGLMGAGKAVILSTLTPKSFEELDQIIKPYINHAIGQHVNYDK
jgi:hypothetical protein